MTVLPRDAQPFPDFHPVLGHFEVPLHRGPGAVGAAAPAPVRWGVPPVAVAASLLATRTSGIIGSDLLVDRAAAICMRRGIFALAAPVDGEQ